MIGAVLCLSYSSGMRSEEFFIFERQVEVSETKRQRNKPESMALCYGRNKCGIVTGSRSRFR